jgi:hypothetical protein
MVFSIINSHGDPGMPHATREECFEIIDGMVRDGIAAPGGSGSSSTTTTAEW